MEWLLDLREYVLLFWLAGTTNKHGNCNMCNVTVKIMYSKVAVFRICSQVSAMALPRRVAQIIRNITIVNMRADPHGM